MIEFDDVSLRTQARPVLEHASAAFPPGQVTALVDVLSHDATAVLEAIVGLRALTTGRISVGRDNPTSDGLAVRRLACLVPATAPVYVRYSPLQFVRFAAQVGGRHDVSTADALRALRVAELPDRLIDQPRARLTAVERLSVWLAIYAVRQTSVLLIDDPFVALTPAQAATGARLIREACAPNHVIVVTGRPRDLPRGCADRFLSIETRDLRVLTPSASTVAFVGTAESAQP